MLTPSRQARLPILNSQQCDRTCRAFDWVPDDYTEIAAHLLPPIPHPDFGPPAPPPFVPAQDPVWSMPSLTITSTPICSKSTSLRHHLQTELQKDIDRRTKRAANFLRPSPPTSSFPDVPSSVSTLADLMGVDPPSQPAQTLASSSTSQPAPSASSSSSTQHRYTESLDPTWAAWRGERMWTREKAFQEHEARRAKNVVDMVNFNVVVWTEQDKSFLELERQVARRLACSWSFGEDTMLCEIAGLNKATKLIYKFIEDRKGNCRWKTVEFTHAFHIYDDGYYFLACYDLDTTSLVNFRQVASLVMFPARNLMNRRPRPLPSSSSATLVPQSSAPPSATTPSASATGTVAEASRPRFSIDIPGRAHRTVEVVVPRLDPALKRTYMHIPTPESPIAKRPKPDQSLAMPSGSPEKPIDVDLEVDSDSMEIADSNKSLGSVASTTVEATLESVQGALKRLWPYQYSVHDVDNGFKYINSTLGRLPDKFHDIFKTQFVKGTYHTYRKAWMLSFASRSACADRGNREVAARETY
ncbi:hypothetical protein FRC05_007030 [Tulasnella sp. 425]|nr:hypothetical protein FRC05_007030 [Tulasnella sp. 425]